MTILITGATGTISRHLLTTLADSGRPVRAMARDISTIQAIPGVEAVAGDLEQPRTLTAAFAGVDTVWLLTAAGPSSPHASSNAVWAARQAGVRHLVRLSAIGAAYDAPTRNGRLHALSDAEFKASRIPFTIVKPSAFMQNLFGMVSDGQLFHSWADGKVGLIDARDIAEFAARILLAPAPHTGHTYTITGPASVSMAEVATTLSEVRGTAVVAHDIPAPAAEAAMRQAGMSDWVAEVVAGEYSAAYAAGWGDFTTDTFPAVVGQPARSIADFAADHPFLGARQTSAAS